MALIHSSGILLVFQKEKKIKQGTMFQTLSKRKKNVEQNLFLPYPLPKR